MRIALFTPFSPDIGGGSVQLRSHLAQLPELDVRWYYLAPAQVPGERRHWLGKPVSPWQFAADLAARCGFLGSTQAVKSIVDRLDADLYWVVGHYEGISVASELQSRGKPVHLTVHDEPLAMVIRSRRYQPLWPLMAHTFADVLRRARSVDVTSTAMRDYFNQKYGVNSFALYKYLPELPLVTPRVCANCLTVGHIGSLYHPTPFQNFVLACRSLAQAQNRALKIVRIGSSPEMDQVAAQGLATFESHRELLEQDALPVLATCDFVYAMYPSGVRFRGFRRTSLPIKLSTYVQAQRPIFAHSPGDSGLAKLVSRHRVGTVCSSQDHNEIQNAIKLMLETTISPDHFEALRVDLMGPTQLQLLKQTLTTQ